MMCRTKSRGGRRCPCHSNPEHRRRASALQRASRYARWTDAAADAGDVVAEARYDRLLMGAMTDLNGTIPDPQPAEPVSRAAEFTEDRTAGWSDAELEAALNECWDDPAAVDQLMHVIDARQAEADMARARSAELHAKAQAQQFDPWDTQASALTNPARRPSRRVSAKEQARAEFEQYLDCQWMQAESDCRGVLLNSEGRARGMDSRSLFQGPLARAEKYASEELLSWWGRFGRLNFAAFRHQMLGYESDRAAADRVRRATFDNAPAWSEAS